MGDGDTARRRHRREKCADQLQDGQRGDEVNIVFDITICVET